MSSILCVVLGLALFGCARKGDSKVKLTELENRADEIIEFEKGRIDFDRFHIVAFFSDGTSKDVEVADDGSMISAEDKEKFNFTGVHTINVYYRGRVLPVQISVVDRPPAKMFTADFDSCGGSPVPSFTGTCMKISYTPAKEGFRFAGWYGNADFTGSKLTTPYFLTKEERFYAKWVDNRSWEVKFLLSPSSPFSRDGEYVLKSFAVENGKGITEDSYPDAEDVVIGADGKEITAGTLLHLDGKKFEEWKLDTEMDLNRITSDICFYPRYSDIECCIMVDAKPPESGGQPAEGAVTEKFTVSYGYTLTADDLAKKDIFCPEKDGYKSEWEVLLNEDTEGVPWNNYLESGLKITEELTYLKVVHTIRNFPINVYNATSYVYERQDFSGKPADWADGVYFVKRGEDYEPADTGGEPVPGTEYYLRVRNSAEREDLKKGVVRLERVSPGAGKNFNQNYGGSFNLFGYVTDKLNLSAPLEVNGFTGDWCAVSEDGGREVWTKLLTGQVWNDEAEKFEGEEKTAWRLKSGETEIADVETGVLENIRGEITIKPKYAPKIYDVNIHLPGETGGFRLARRFSVKYLTDFKLYDPDLYKLYYPDLYEDKNFENALDVENFYLEEINRKTASWMIDAYWMLGENGVEIPDDPDTSEDERNKFAHLYSLDYDIESWKSDWRRRYSHRPEDWALSWYYDSSYNGDKIPFDPFDFDPDGNPEFGSFEVRDKPYDLYLKAVDRRRYYVEFRYDYDFENGQYKETWKPPTTPIAFNAHIDPPYPSDIARKYEHYDNDSVLYEFDDWYDCPYVPDSDYVGDEFYAIKFDDPANKRTRNTIYYAHYRCDTTYTVKIYDQTQSVAYNTDKADENGYKGKNYDVDENGIIYTVKAGDEINSAMIFKNYSPASSIPLSGQTLYNEWKDLEYCFPSGGGVSGIDRDLKTIYEKPVYNSFFPENWADMTEEERIGIAKANKSALSNKIADLLAAKKSELENYTDLLSDIYGYSPDLGGEERYGADFKTEEDYIALRKEIYDLKADLAFVDGYDDKVAAAEGYKRKRDESWPDGPFYKPYKDSEEHLNKAYGKDYPDEKRYTFAGWYDDKNYSSSKDSNFDFSFRVFCDEDRYAKWVDQEKGSEGLVFRKIEIDDGERYIGYIVVDFMTADEYESSEYRDRERVGSPVEPYEYPRDPYDVNFNDVGLMPGSLGKSKNIDLQIPADHIGKDGVARDVVGVCKRAFERHGCDIKTITLSGNVRFVEENAFSEWCPFLESIYATENDYISFDVDNGALYQVNGDLVTLIAFPPKGGNEICELRADTRRVGEGAFFGASELKRVVFNDGLESVGNRAFKGCGSLGIPLSDDSPAEPLRLPDSLEKIGVEAFRDCGNIKSVEVSPGSSLLSFTGADAFAGTDFLETQAGIITLHGIVIGYRAGSDRDFTKGENGENKTVPFIDANNNSVMCKTIRNGVNVCYYNDDNALLGIEIKEKIIAVADGALGSALDNNGKPVENDDELSSVGKIIIDGEKLKNVGQRSFSNCSALQEFKIENITRDACVDPTAFDGCREGIKLLVPHGSELDVSWRLLRDEGKLIIEEYFP